MATDRYVAGIRPSFRESTASPALPFNSRVRATRNGSKTGRERDDGS